MPNITLLPENQILTATADSNLLEVLRQNGVILDAPCGGHRTCGKCRVLLNDVPALSCQTVVQEDMTVALLDATPLQIMEQGIDEDIQMDPLKNGPLLAFDIGTTSVVCYLLDQATGEALATDSVQNPQTTFGADVISRIRAAMGGQQEAQTAAIRYAMEALIKSACRKASVEPADIGVIAVVANPCMQQLFLGLPVNNLATIPFAPILKQVQVTPAIEVLPICPNASLITIPDISGYVGADTIGCVLSTSMYKSEDITLMVDIGTNGEMVLGNRDRMIACSTAAGPALEGANIQCGMRGTTGAIDHVWLEDGVLKYSVIGDVPATGICGSGLIDAVAALLERGVLNKRGRILSDYEEQDGQRLIRLADEVWLTQEDIRQVQMAKGAIQAGIVLMAKQLGIEQSDIRRVLLAGAFGSYMRPESACRIGLLPSTLSDRITAVGNAAGSGARQIACSRRAMEQTQFLADQIEFLALAALPDFSRCFAKSMTLENTV